NINSQLELVAWFLAYWKLTPNTKRDLMLEKVTSGLDPHNAEPAIREVQMRLAFATLDPKKFQETDKKLELRVAEIRNENITKAEERIPAILERDPGPEARLRFRLAETLYSFQEPKRDEQAIKEARKALDLDANAPGPRWQLTDSQRAQVKKWLKIE